MWASTNGSGKSSSISNKGTDIDSKPLHFSQPVNV